MTIQFQKATVTQAKARLAIIGSSGSGKTWTSLAVGTKLGDRVALIDTEHGSASKYAREFAFDTVSLDSFSPLTYVEAIRAAEAAGYDVIIIDSLSHAWSGKDGALEQVDRRSQGNKFTAWREVTPMHNALIEAILQSRAHVISTMRVKTEYVVEQDSKGRSVPRKVGLAPIQRDGMEYEMDVVGEIDQDHNLRITKTRCSSLADQVIAKPGADLAATLKAWLSDGAPVPAPRQSTPITDEAKSVVETLRMAAAAAADQKPYQLAASYLKANAYKSWSDFYERGANEDAAMLEQILRPVTEPLAETPELLPA